ncbi:MAG: hypothetical protein WBC01_06935 [Solirubrobacterales bacterium]
MATSNVVFGSSDGGDHSLEVAGPPATVIDALRNGWARLDASPHRNRHRYVRPHPTGLDVSPTNEDPEWVWVNADNVLYVEPIET